MAKQLKIWNGRGHGKYSTGYTFYVAAYSASEAARLISKAAHPDIGREDLVGVHEINTYYSKGSWGNSMNGIDPTEPCVYVGKSFSK